MSTGPHPAEAPPHPQPVPVRAVAALVAELAARAAADGSPPPLLLDVREDAERAVARLRLPGTADAHIPLGQLARRIGELDPAQPVLALCHHGVRSLHALMLLRHHGFGRLYNLSGGIDAWSLQVDPQIPRY